MFTLIKLCQQQMQINTNIHPKKKNNNNIEKRDNNRWKEKGFINLHAWLCQSVFIMVVFVVGNV